MKANTELTTPAGVPVDPGRELTCAELARLVGSRRGGRPTDPETVRGWMLDGLAGVRLESWLDIATRKTTWAKYLAWKGKVERRKEELRQSRREAVRGDRGRQTRQRRARKELERAGAR